MPGMALTETEIRNRDHVLALYRDVLDPHDRTRLRQYLVEDYIQHSPEATDGLEGIGNFLDWLRTTHPGHRNHIQRIFAQDDHVIVHLRVTVPGEADLAVVDIFRLNQAGMIAEHWDIVQRVPENPKNGNGMF
jgi:predicted SnoaL-like aldol condensation-catalyzing enzyme